MKKTIFSTFVAIFAILTGINNLQAYEQFDYGKSNGMSIDLGFDYGFAIVENDSFKISPIGVIGTLNNATFNQTVFDAKSDYNYGGVLAFGYMMENGVGAQLELGYHQMKLKDQNNVDSFLKPSLFSGMINATYNLNFGFLLSPYVTIGAGLGRIDMKGTLYDDQDHILDFKSLKKNSLIYQAGGGILFGSRTNIGIGYKFLGMKDIEDSETFNDVIVSTAASDASIAIQIPSENFKFGTFENRNHIVSVFARFLF